jgi:hypothetical protein
MAHGGSRHPDADHARSSGPVGGAFPNALWHGSGRREVRRRDRSGRDQRPQRRRAVPPGRVAPPRNDARSPWETAARFPRGREHHRRKRPRPQQRRIGDDRRVSDVRGIARGRGVRAPRGLRRRGRGARHVRTGSRSCGPTGASPDNSLRSSLDATAWRMVVRRGLAP